MFLKRILILFVIFYLCLISLVTWKITHTDVSHEKQSNGFKSTNIVKFFVYIEILLNEQTEDVSSVAGVATVPIKGGFFSGEYLTSTSKMSLTIEKVFEISTLPVKFSAEYLTSTTKMDLAAEKPVEITTLPVYDIIENRKINSVTYLTTSQKMDFTHENPAITTEISLIDDNLTEEMTTIGDQENESTLNPAITTEISLIDDNLTEEMTTIGDKENESTLYMTSSENSKITSDSREMIENTSSKNNVIMKSPEETQDLLQYIEMMMYEGDYKDMYIDMN